MLVHYLRLFYRSLGKDKWHYAVSVAGLAVGISCFIFSMVFFFFEFSFDNQHVKHDRIARIVSKVKTTDNETNTALANGFLAYTLPDEFPEVQEVVRFKRVSENLILKGGKPEKVISIANCFLADAAVFNVFSYPLLEGDPAACLVEPNTVVISAEIASKFFGTASALNELMMFDGRSLKVTGIMENLPQNSNMKFDALVSSETVPLETIKWAYTYLLFDQPEAVAAFQPKLDQYTEESVKPVFANEGIDIRYSLEPLRDIHFSTNTVYDTQKGNKIYVYIFLGTGILILTIACINYINLTVVKSFSRTRQVSIQIVFGASQPGLFWRFVLESFLVSVIAGFLAILAVYFLMPTFSSVVNRSFGVSDALDWRIAGFIVLVLVVLTVSGGIYMVYYSRAMQLSDALLSVRSGQGIKPRLVSKAILGFQFFISIAMITAGLVVYRQVDYLKDSPLGFNPDNVLVVELPTTGNSESGVEQLQFELGNNRGVKMLSRCGGNSLPGQFASIDVFEYLENGVSIRKATNNISVDENYFRLLEIPVSEGTAFKDGDASASDAMVSQMFAKRAKWQEATGNVLKIPGHNELQIAGMVADFHFNSLHSPIEPLVIIHDTKNPAYLLIRIEDGKSRDVIGALQQSWIKSFLEYPLHYFFLEEHLLRQYQDERNLGKLLLVLTLLIVVISCMGLMSYCSFVIKQASLETAMRRVLGASFLDILKRFARQFIILLAIGFVLACVVSGYLLSEWLDQFSYRVAFRFTEFFIALGCIGVIIAIVVAYYTVLGVRVNPVKTLREN